MHPFPPAADLQFLIGEEIGQIVLDPYGLQFRFINGDSIAIEGRIDHVDRRGNSHPHDCQANARPALYLHQLLQHRVTKVEAEPFCLSLTFDDGAALRIFSNEGRYECGHIASVDGLIVF